MKSLRKIGKDINDARGRRRITMEFMAECAGLSPATIGKIQKGDSTTSMGGDGSVLFVLGMEDKLGDLVESVHDLIGRKLKDEKFPQRVRSPGSKKGVYAKKVFIMSNKVVRVSILLEGEDMLVGKLWFYLQGSKESVSFECDQQWLKTPQKFALEPALKLTKRIFHLGSGILVRLVIQLPIVGGVFSCVREKR